jgi:hypothetical protein
MRALMAAVAVLALALPAWAGSGTELRVDFSNPNLNPSHWTLVLYPDGSGHFRSERGKELASPPIMEPVTVDRDIRLSLRFTDHVFEVVRQSKLFSQPCDSHMKVAFQGWKKITYISPEGEQSCEFNYSKNKQIQALGDAFVGVASTIVEGARLEMLREHDPLGLDSEMGFILEATGDGRLRQICAIRGILEKLEADPSVMERVRKRARMVLARAEK